MIDLDIEQLVARDADTDLRRLERDVWYRVAKARVDAAASRRLASYQALVLTLAIVVSATMGVTTAMAIAAHRATPIAPGENLAPSSLLFGPTR